VGTPISINALTRNRAFGHYARILVDIDLSKRVFDEILVEIEGFAFKVEVQYECRPLFCHHCYVIGHNVTTCKWLYSEASKENRGKSKVTDISKKVPSILTVTKELHLLVIYSMSQLFHKIQPGT